MEISEYVVVQYLKYENSWRWGRLWPTLITIFFCFCGGIIGVIMFIIAVKNEIKFKEYNQQIEQYRLYKRQQIQKEQDLKNFQSLQNQITDLQKQIQQQDIKKRD